MINNKQFRELIIQPTLHDLVMNSKDAEELLVFTCAVESLGGTYIKQEGGPAIGIYQIEPRTYNDLWQNYIYKRPQLCLILASNFQAHLMPDEQRLIYDLRFATAMARIFYLRVKEELPPANDLDAIWNFYKTHYNTSKGSAIQANATFLYHQFLRN